MRIAITHPYCWPHVRRGNERNIEELAIYLTSRGHDVVTVSTNPGAARTEKTSYGPRVLSHGYSLRPLRLAEHHFFLYQAWRSLRELKVDAVHSWFFTDGLAANWARRTTGNRVVLQINGVPIPGVSCYNKFPPEASMYRASIRGADHRVVCSRFIADQLGEVYGATAEVIPPPVNMERYALGPGSGGAIRLAAVGDFTVKRKGLRVLLEAFAKYRQGEPEAELRIAGNHPQLPPQAGVTFLGPQPSEAVTKLYQESSCLLVPSMWEPSGTVVIEALACGTPVVATRHAGIPEFVSPEVAALFDPLTNGEETMNAEGLAEAIEAGVVLSKANGIRERCREFANRFSFATLGPAIERAYRG